MSLIREQGVFLKSLTQEDVEFFWENRNSFIALDLSVMNTILPPAARRAGDWPISSRQYPDGPTKAWEIKRYLSWHLGTKIFESSPNNTVKNAEPGDWFAAWYQVNDLSEVTLHWRIVSRTNAAVLWRTVDTTTLGEARDRLQHWSENHFLYLAMGNLLFPDLHAHLGTTEQSNVITEDEKPAVGPVGIQENEPIIVADEAVDDEPLVPSIDAREVEAPDLIKPFPGGQEEALSVNPAMDRPVQELSSTRMVTILPGGPLPIEGQVLDDSELAEVVPPKAEVCDPVQSRKNENSIEITAEEPEFDSKQTPGSEVSRPGTIAAVLAQMPAGIPEAPAVSYEDFNAAICNSVFDGRYRLAPVYLDLESDLIFEICDRLGIPAASFEASLGHALSDSLHWQKDDPLIWHTVAFSKWLSSGRNGAPPFTGVLCALSAAAGRMRQDDSFTAQNYYERLFELLHIDGDDKKQKIRGTGKSVRRFWEALNKWLAENDFEYGRPTARRVNSWPYVSYALSQALIRDADVQRFHHMFEYFSLSPNDRLSEAEMEPYLYQWMRGSGPSQWLKRVWNSNDLRSRVVAAACSELERWDGLKFGETQSSAVRSMFWIASLRNLPRREVRLFLTGPELTSDAALNLKLVLGESDAALDAFSKCKDGLFLINSPTGSFSVLEPTNKFSLSPLFQASFDLRSSETAAFKRTPRPIIPLLKLETGRYFKEVNRISFLRMHLVFCHERWKSDVVNYLQQHARPGYKELDDKKIQGLPEDWYLFSEVEIISAGDDVKDSLQVLVPLSDGAALDLSGGLRLGQGLWHSDVPPDITAVSPHDGLSIDLVESHSLDVAKPLLHIESQSNVCLLALAGRDFPTGSELTVIVTDSDKHKSEKSLSLRSADTPSRMKSDIGDIGYCLSPENARGFLTASEVSQSFVGCIVRGMYADLQGELAPAAASEVKIADLGTGSAIAEEADDISPGYITTRAVGLPEACVVRGYHHWMCESFEEGDSRSDAKWMQCKYCSNSVLTRNRGSRRISRRSENTNTMARQPLAPGIPARREAAIAPDILFDAVCYTGSGRLTQLRDLTSQHTDAAWYASSFIRVLDSLGHIDIQFDSTLRRAEFWKCSPPSLTILSDGSAFLSGFRSKRLLEEISRRLKITSAQEVRIQKDAPAAYFFQNVTLDRAREVLADAEISGHKILIGQSAAMKIVDFSPPVSRIITGLPSIHIEDFENLQFFDLSVKKWVPVERTTNPGAYRISFAGQRYFYRTRSGELLESGYEVVKLLAARDEGVRLHGYDAGTRNFVCFLGCEPPGVLRRALTACSGLVPKTGGGKLFFSNVDHDVARLLMQKLYN